MAGAGSEGVVVRGGAPHEVDSGETHAAAVVVIIEARGEMVDGLTMITTTPRWTGQDLLQDRYPQKG